MARINWFLLGLAYFSLFTFGLGDNARGPVFPDLLRDFGLNDALGSLFFFVSSAAAMANNSLAFLWLERFTSYRSLQFYSVIQAIGLVVMGLSQSYPVMLLGCSLFGLSMGGLGITLNLLASEAVPPERRRQALSGLHCMYGIASLLAPLLVTGLFQQGVGWKQVFLWIALGPVLLGALSLFAFARDGNEDKKNASEVSREGAEGRKPWGHALFYAVMVSAYVIAEIAISTRLVLFARRDAGFGVEDANAVLSGFFLALFAGRFLFAVVRFPLRSATILAFSGGFSLLGFCLGLLHHPAWLSLCGFTMSMFYPCAMALVAEETGRWSGFVTSWILTCQALGLMAMHFLVGWLSDLFGLGRALWIGPLCLILMLFLLGNRSRLKPLGPVSSR